MKRHDCVAIQDDMLLVNIVQINKHMENVGIMGQYSTRTQL